jgi:hypothetical protein
LGSIRRRLIPASSPSVGAGATPGWVTSRRMTSAMAADETQIPLDEQLGEIGAQLDWVRGYL